METIAGLVLWILANVVYVDMRRTGQRGFKRLVAFWLGWPGTLVALFSVDESSQPAVRKDDRGLGELVAEIRKDRQVRGPEAGPGLEAGPPPGRGGDGEAPGRGVT